MNAAGNTRLDGGARRCRLLAALLVLPALETAAVEFNAAISPPRFELRAAPGDVVRQTIRISNLGDTPAEFTARTADWGLSETGGLTVHGEDLQEGSCRPWTRIERHRVSVAPSRERQYRFEVHVPEGAPRGECRFAIVFQQLEETADRMTMGSVSLPVLGQVAIIVYVNVGGADPELHLRGVTRSGPDNREVALLMENTGDAHGRPRGIMRLTVPDGAVEEYVVAPVAILPGTRRLVPLWPGDRSRPEAVQSFPVTVRGTVEWRGGKHDVRATVE